MSNLTIHTKAKISYPTLGIMPSILYIHVQSIVYTPSLKNGGGKELRKLHDSLQHIRALGNLGCDLPGSFITSMIELNLDVDTLFEWQKHSQENTDVPSCEDLFSFIDVRV